MKLKSIVLQFLVSLILCFFTLVSSAQTNPRHVRVSGYYRSNGTYVQPYFRTAPNHTNSDNFSTLGNVNPYTGKPGWILPDNKYNTLYYNTYDYTPSQSTTAIASSSPQIRHKDRTYIEDEQGKFSSYLKVRDQRTFDIYDLHDQLILYLVINHRGDWRVFDPNGIYIKTIFVVTEK